MKLTYNGSHQRFHKMTPICCITVITLLQITLACFFFFFSSTQIQVTRSIFKQTKMHYTVKFYQNHLMLLGTTTALSFFWRKRDLKSINGT